MNNRGKYSHKCNVKKLATLFFKLSTRTRKRKKLRFEVAMMKLEGNVLGLPSTSSSSKAKGKLE